MAYSPLLSSLPDLTVPRFASPAASRGGPLTVTVNVSTLGASTIIEPLALAPGSTSAADAPPSTVTVYATLNPHTNRGAIPVGTVNIPTVPQNTTIQITQQIT